MAASAHGDSRGTGEERAVDHPRSRVSDVGPLVERHQIDEEPRRLSPLFMSVVEHEAGVQAILGEFDPEHQRVVGIVGV